MEYVEYVMNLVLENIGVNPVMLKDLRKILNFGLVEIKLLTNLYNNLNLMRLIIQIVLNGYLLKNLKMSLILQKVDLVKFILVNFLKDLFVIGILIIKNGVG